MRRMSFRMHNGRLFHRYQCARQPGQGQCGRVAITQASTDDHVAGLLLDFLSVAELRPLEGEGDEPALEAGLAEAEEALADLVRDRYVRRTIKARDFEPARAALAAEVEDLEGRLTALRRGRDERAASIPLGDRDALQAWWDGASPAERVEQVRRSVARVTVAPGAQRGGNRFDPGRLAVHLNEDLYQAWWRRGDAGGWEPLTREELDAFLNETDGTGWRGTDEDARHWTSASELAGGDE
jgi:hypothetical protein